jgi:putative ABC transport system substrate-binding protein
VIGRREFIAGLGSAAAWPVVARAQQDGRVRRIGMLIGGPDDPVTQAWAAAVRGGLTKLGWIEGRNLRMDLRFSGDGNRISGFAAELVSFAPDLIVTSSGNAFKTVQQETRTIPIVFVAAGDVVTNGLVSNIARPEGNATGFANFYSSIGGKWVELLKEAAPHVARVALIFNPEIGRAFFDSIEATAAALTIKAIKTPVSSAAEIERAIDAFAAEPNGGLVVMPGAFTLAHREIIIRLAAQHRLPAIYSNTTRVADGGLIAYAPDFNDLHRRAASYVDRILRGTKVRDLPVQFPTKFELAVNLKTAKALGLTIPEKLLATADQVIE